MKIQWILAPWVCLFLFTAGLVTAEELPSANANEIRALAPASTDQDDFIRMLVSCTDAAPSSGNSPEKQSQAKKTSVLSDYWVEATQIQGNYYIPPLEYQFLKKRCEQSGLAQPQLQARTSRKSKHSWELSSEQTSFRLQAPDKPFNTLVHYDEHQEPKINKSFNSIVGDIHSLIERSYALTFKKGQGLSTLPFDSDARCPDTWVCRNPVSGSQGVFAKGFVQKYLGAKVEPDYPVSISYLRLKDKTSSEHTDHRTRASYYLVITFRGTQTGQSGFFGSDWNANYDRELRDYSALYGLQPGTILWHRAWGNRYLRLQGRLYQDLSETIRSIQQYESDPKKRKELLNHIEIIVTGHSQGGAMAQICAFDLIQNFTVPDKATNSQLNLNSGNRIKLYTLSAPKVAGSPSTAMNMEYVTGRLNTVRLTSPFDPVPHTGSFYDWKDSLPNRTIGKLIQTPLFWALRASSSALSYFFSGFSEKIDNPEVRSSLAKRQYTHFGTPAFADYQHLIEKFLQYEEEYNPEYNKKWNQKKIDALYENHFHLIQNVSQGRAIKKMALIGIFLSMKGDFLRLHHFCYKSGNLKTKTASFRPRLADDSLNQALRQGVSLEAYIYPFRKQRQNHPVRETSPQKSFLLPDQAR